jgi:hypothetical protein
MLLLLIPVLGIAVFFAPVLDSSLLEAGVTSAAVRDEGRGEELFLRIYSAYDAGENSAQGSTRQGRLAGQRPLLVLIPPLRGSVPIIDRVCGELRNTGFTVVAYSKRGFDSPAVGPGRKKHPLSLNRQVRMLRAESWGRTIVSANAIGRSLEEDRRRDIEFLLDLLRQNKRLPASLPQAMVEALAETDRSAVFLAGYDAGGAALLELASVPDFAARYPAVKGLIAVESPLHSVLIREQKTVPLPSSDNWFIARWMEIRSRAKSLLPQRITGIGEVPRPGVPVCFILSDRVLETRHRNDRYAAILKVFHSAKAPAILTTADGAGPLDYSDIPEKYPLYRVFQLGREKSLFQGTHGTRETAALMTNFAATILDSGQERRGGESSVLSRESLTSRNLYIETNDGWNSLRKGFIL